MSALGAEPTKRVGLKPRAGSSITFEAIACWMNIV